MKRLKVLWILLAVVVLAGALAPAALAAPDTQNEGGDPPRNAVAWRTYAVLGAAVVFGALLWFVFKRIEMG